MSYETKVRTRAKGWGAVSLIEKIVLVAALVLAVAEFLTGLDLPLHPVILGVVPLITKAARAVLTWKAGVEFSTLDPKSAIVMLSVFVLTALVPSSVPPVSPVPAVGPAPSCPRDAGRLHGAAGRVWSGFGVGTGGAGCRRSEQRRGACGWGGA